MSETPKPLPPPSAEKKVQVTIWIDPVLHKALKHEGVDRSMSVSEIISEALYSRQLRSVGQVQMSKHD